MKIEIETVVATSERRRPRRPSPNDEPESFPGPFPAPKEVIVDTGPNHAEVYRENPISNPETYSFFIRRKGTQPMMQITLSQQEAHRLAKMVFLNALQHCEES